MSDRPIIFSAPMVQALLAGRKTQTRRISKKQDWPEAILRRHPQQRACVPYLPGDRLWVREAHYLTDDGDSEYAVYAEDEQAVREHLARIDRLPINFPEEVKAAHRKLRPSIHLLRWASRLTLVVTDVRVERLQDIAEADAIAEGWPHADADPTRIALRDKTPNGWFEGLWGEIHGIDAWAANPWVAAITFTVHHENIDALPSQEAA